MTLLSSSVSRCFWRAALAAMLGKHGVSPPGREAYRTGREEYRTGREEFELDKHIAAGKSRNSNWTRGVRQLSLSRLCSITARARHTTSTAARASGAPFPFRTPSTPPARPSLAFIDCTHEKCEHWTCINWCHCYEATFEKISSPTQRSDAHCEIGAQLTKRVERLKEHGLVEGRAGIRVRERSDLARCAVSRHAAKLFPRHLAT